MSLTCSSKYSKCYFFLYFGLQNVFLKFSKLKCSKILHSFAMLIFVSFVPVAYLNAAQSNLVYLVQDAAMGRRSLTGEYNRSGL